MCMRHANTLTSSIQDVNFDVIRHNPPVILDMLLLERQFLKFGFFWSWNTRKAFLPQRDFLLFSVLNSLSLFLPLSVAFTNPKVIRPSFYYTTTESQNERTCQLWDTAMVHPQNKIYRITEGENPLDMIDSQGENQKYFSTIYFPDRQMRKLYY